MGMEEIQCAISLASLASLDARIAALLTVPTSIATLEQTGFRVTSHTAILTVALGTPVASSC